MAKNPLDKTKGLYVPDPTEQKKSKGILKKVLVRLLLLALVLEASLVEEHIKKDKMSL